MVYPRMLFLSEMDWFTLSCDECRERNGLHSHVINGVKRNATVACDEWTEMESFFLVYYE